jgi:uncharacterized protein YuzE
MKLTYDPKTDSLYIAFNSKTSVDSIEVSEGIVMDLDNSGKPVGMDIQHASKTFDLNKLETHSLPFKLAK